MSHRFEDSCNMNILHRKIKFIRTWIARKVEFLSEITPFLVLELEYANYLVPIQRFSSTFYDLASIGFKLTAKIMRGSCVFFCSRCISFNSTSNFKECFMMAAFL